MTSTSASSVTTSIAWPAVDQAAGPCRTPTRPPPCRRRFAAATHGAGPTTPSSPPSSRAPCHASHQRRRSGPPMTTWQKGRADIERLLATGDLDRAQPTGALQNGYDAARKAAIALLAAQGLRGTTDGGHRALATAPPHSSTAPSIASGGCDAGETPPSTPTSTRQKSPTPTHATRSTPPS